MYWVEIQDLSKPPIAGVITVTSTKAKAFKMIDSTGSVLCYHVSYTKVWPESASLSFKDGRFSYCYFQDLKAYAGHFDHIDKLPEEFKKAVEERK